MKEKVELPMNKKPYIHSNISRASLFSVLTSEAYAGSLNAELSRLSFAADGESYDGLCLEKAESKCQNMQMKKTGEKNSKLLFSSHPYTERKYAYFYQHINGKKAFFMETAVEYLQRSNSDSHVKLVLSETSERGKEAGSGLFFREEVSLKLFSDGRLSLYLKGQERFLNKADMERPVYLRLKKNIVFSAEYSQDGEKWTKIYQDNIDFTEKMEAGFYIEPKINPFYYDFFTSHIQLCYTWDNKIIAPHFDYYERYFSKLIPVMQIPMNILEIENKKIIEYFISLISQKYYINLGVDEFYIPGREHYGKRHFMHVNFIYGFDRRRRVFQLMGFDHFLKFSEIDFDDFYYAIQRKIDKNTKINIYRYHSGSNPDALHVNAVLYMLKAYLSGTNCFAVSASEVILEDDRKPIVYGLDIHELICAEEEHMDRFLRDIRIIYQIYEHNLIMREMIGFIYYLGMLSEKCYERYTGMFNKAVQLSAKIKNVILKNRMAPREHIEDKIRDMLMDLKNKEMEAIQELLDTLETRDAEKDENGGL